MFSFLKFSDNICTCHACVRTCDKTEKTYKQNNKAVKQNFAPFAVKQKNLAAVTDMDSTHQKGYQSKLLLVHLKGGQCNFLRSS